MAYTWEKDADDIHRAFAKFSADKAVLIGKQNATESLVFFILYSFITLFYIKQKGTHLHNS